MSVRSLNKVMLIGNLTRDPEMRYTGNGTAVATFGLATNRSWKDQDGELQEAAEFHNIVAWAKMAEICQQLLTKGVKVYVEGELRTRSWDGDDGVTRYRTEIRIDNMILLTPKSGGGDGMSVSDDSGASDDDIPFDDDDNGSSSKSSKSKKNKKVEDSPEANEEDENPEEDDLPF